MGDSLDLGIGSGSGEGVHDYRHACALSFIVPETPPPDRFVKRVGDSRYKQLEYQLLGQELGELELDDFVHM